jgi:hypothetical protein
MLIQMNRILEQMTKVITTIFATHVIARQSMRLVLAVSVANIMTPNTGIENELV